MTVVGLDERNWKDNEYWYDEKGRVLVATNL